MKKMLRLFTTLVLVSICCIAFSYAGVGTSGMSFLRIGAGARPAGMGDAFTALSDDVNALYWNPAGLTQLKNREVSAMYLKWLGDLNYEFIGLVLPRGSMALGAAFYRLGMEPFEEINTLGESVGSLSYNSMAFALSFALAMNKMLSIGCSAKGITETLVDKSSFSVGLDIGALYSLSSRLKLGANVRNIGAQMQSFGDTKEELPTTVNIGAYARAMESANNTLNIVADVVIKPTEGQTEEHVGGELYLGKKMALRLGYKIGSVDSFTLGGSINLGKIKLDLAYIPFSDWDVTYRAALTFVF